MNEDTRKVKVFAESPEWDKVEKWWMLRPDIAEALYITTYVCNDDSQAEFEFQIAHIRELHPNAVLVYVSAEYPA